jgi:hypothetical protein
MKYLSITVDHQPTDCGCSPFHPTIGSEAFILSTLATPVPSHDITRELLQFLRDSLSLCHRDSSAGLSDAPSASSSRIFCSGHVFCKFSEILSLVLSSNQNNLSSFQFFFSAGEPHTLPLFFCISGSHIPLVCLLLVFLHVFLHAFLLLRKVLDLSCSFCQKETRVSLGLQEKLPSVVLRADSFLSPQPDPPCFHSLG